MEGESPPPVQCSVEDCSEALLAAVSPEYGQIKHAEQMIQRLETQSNFFPILAEMSITNNFPIDVRRMAAICVKNGVTKFWRSLSQNAICKRDKTKIKEVLLRAHLVEQREVFDQLVVVMSKIARYDYPKLWSALTPALVQAISSSEAEETKLRALTLLYKVLKELSTKRLLVDKKNFREATDEIFPLAGSLWQTYLGHLQTSPSLPSLQHSLTSLKLLRSFLTYGFEDITRARGCLEEILKLAQPQLDHRLSISDEQLAHLYDKYLKVMVKLLSSVQEKYPRFFGQYLGPVLEFGYQIAFHQSDRLQPELVACSLHLLSGIVNCENYDVFKMNNKGVDVSQEDIGFMDARNTFFTESRLREMTMRCISHNLRLSEVELKDWQDYPEEFAYEETRHVELYSIKAASEHFLLNLTATFQDIVCPHIVSLVTECSQHDRTDLQTVLMIDAVYSITVICSYDLFDYLDIETWFSSLQTEIEQDGPFAAILQRRILEVVGRWVTIKLSQDRHPAVYGMCIQHMSPHHDLVVRLTAASALEAAVGDFAFYPSAFSGFLGGAVEGLYELLRQVEECESRVKILGVLNAIIEGCDKHIKGFVEPLIGWLPGLWNVAEEHVMLQTQLLLTARKLSQCLGEDSPNLYSFTEPVLAFVMTKDPEMVLLEDGLALWLAILQNAPSSTPQLISLFEGLDKLLQLGSENLKTSLLIVECTILLDPPSIASRYGGALLSACSRLYPEVSGEARILITNILLTFLKTVPRESWPGETEPMFNVVLSSLREREGDYSKVLSTNMYVVFYLVMLDLPRFHSLIASFNDNTILQTIVTGWIDQSQHFYRMENHKLSLLALLTLAVTDAELTKYFFNDIIKLMARAVDKCTDTDDKGFRYDILLRKLKTDSDYLMGETQDYQRRKALIELDATSRIDILVFVRGKVSELQHLLGLEAFYKLSKGVDTEITDRVAEFLS